MAVLQVQLDSGSTFAFDVEGELIVSQDREYTNNSNLLSRYSEVWVVEDAYFSLGVLTTNTDDGATDAGLLFARIDALMTFLDDRDGSPVTAARAVRDPTGAAVTERLLGSPTFERFKVSEVTIGEDPVVDELDAGKWEILVPVSFTVTADRVFSDADAVSEFDQEITFSYSRGFARAEKVTTVRTAEATNAETIARNLGAWNIDDFGPNYYWVTNGDDGVNIQVLDADCRTTANGSLVGGDGAGNERTPTRVQATSIVQQTGSNVGGNTAGNSPQEMNFSIRTETSRNRKTTTWTARAVGPQGRQWVERMAPSGSMTTRITDYDDETRTYTAVWIKEELLTTYSQTSAAISGGAKLKAFRPMTNNKRPRLQLGPFQEYVLTVNVRLETIAATATAASMPFPAVLPVTSGWVFDANESTEDRHPRILEPGLSTDQQKWERNGTFVYRAGAKPDMNIIASALFDSSVFATQATFYG